MHILKSSEMRRGGAALSLINIRKRKFVDSDQISAKKMKVAANNIDNRAENRMSASENDSAAAKIIASDGDSSMPLDDMSEQLIPFYCSASSMVSYSAIALTAELVSDRNFSLLS